MVATRSVWSVWAAAVAVLAVAGCHHPRVVTPMPEHQTFTPGRPVTLIFPRLVSELPGKARASRYAELPRRLARLFGSGSTTTLEERDVTGAPPLDSWVVRVELTEIRAGRSLDVTEFEFELSVYDASGVPVERVATESGIELMVDTSSRSHVLRERYEVPLETRDSAWVSGGPEGEAFEERLSEVLAAQLYSRAAGPIARAIRSAVPQIQTVEATGAVAVPVGP